MRKSILVIASGALVVGLVGLVGCGGRVSHGSDGREAMTIGGRTFLLEVAEDAATQQQGLGGRREIARDGGMLFVFEEAGWQSFVMRDCVIPIDLIYLDETGRVVSVHAMTPEAPRSVDEGNGIDGELRYMARLESYVSGGDAKYAVEVRGGTIAELGIAAGDAARGDRFARAGRGQAK